MNLEEARDARKKLNEAQLREQVSKMRAAGLTMRKIGDALGLSVSTVCKWQAQELTERERAAQNLGKKREFEVALPDKIAPEIDVDELVERRTRAFARKEAHNDATKLVSVKVKVRGPFGVLFFGDPHLDDDGTDWPTLREHVALCAETPALFGANVGDTTNNWIGRLARLYANQSTTAREAWALAEWFVKQIPWLFMIGGNHDLWSGNNDPLEWIAGREGTLYLPSQVRLRLTTPDSETFTINARHDFTGSSQWNSAHGAMKSLLMGLRDDLAVCGHKHTSGWGVVKDPDSGRICHALQVASYKWIDPFARDANFKDNGVSPCALVVFDPSKPVGSTERVTPFWSAEAGARYLTMLREEQGED